jgi:ABC-type glycerol-3-phosphate transport system substrate-binding protein
VASSILAGVPAQAVTEINYWLWDNNQLASYQACAEAFEKQNPDIKIKITQTGWFDYWTALSTAFVSGTAPDVFWDHLSRYPEFISNNLLVDLAPLIARDKVSTDIYVGGLVKVWGRNGKQYGLPKDWDTIGIVYNKAMLAENCKFEIGFAPLPKGPVGRRSVINGLADSIWSGTKHPEEAWKWVEFLASPEAQKIVASYGIVFPAVREATEIAEARMAAKGIDVSAFVDEARDPQGTFFLPITDHGNDAVRILRATFDAIFLDGADAAPKLQAANQEIDSLFQ